MNTNEAIEDIYELSPLQQGLLFHSLAGTDPEMYLAQRSYRLHGELEPQRLAEAWRDVIARHTALRSSFHWDELEKPLQVVHRTAGTDLEVLDWRGLPPGEQRERLDRCLRDDRAAGFDLTAAPLMRLTLVRLADEEFQFVWTHHMILLDGWSVPLVLREIFVRYAELERRGARTALPPVPAYAQYIDWLQRRPEADAERFWRDTMSGAPTSAVPERTAPGTPVRVEVERLRLSPELTGALQQLAARQRVTLNSVVQAAWALLLARHAGAAEAVFGMTTSGRPAALPGVESMVGLFINTVPLRIPVPDGPEPVGAWLREVQERQAAVREYEFSSLSQIRRWSGAPGGRPLYDSIVVFESYPVPADVRLGVSTLRISTDSSVEKTSEPLTVLASLEPELTLRLQYHPELHEPAMIVHMAAQLGTVLEQLTLHEDGSTADLRLITEAEYRRQQTGWNDTARSYPGADTLHGLVEEQARRTPGAVAVRSAEERLHYAELDARAEERARVLRAAGAGPGTLVAVCGERSSALVVSLLAVLKSGAAYLPLDPQAPPERLRRILADARPALAISDRQLDAGCPALPMTGDWPAPAPEGAAASDRPTGADPAYVIYTSGSTGAPKGVPIPHRAIRNRLLWMQDTFPLGPQDRVLQKTPYDFDVSVWEFFWPLLAGAQLVLARPGGHRDPGYLVRAVAQEGVTVAHFVPSMLRHFLAEPGAGELPGLRQVFCSGEALPPQLRERFLDLLPKTALHNLYGPTEAAVDVTWWDCGTPGPGGSVPIGRPVANTRIHLLDGHGRPVPVGVPGELCIAGVQLTPGYLNRPELTADRFRTVAGLGTDHGAGSPPERLYRSGDLARRLPDGTLQYLGRLDHQVKVRGVRIEPGEVEHALTRHPGVTAAAVIARTDPGTHGDGEGEARLVGYAVPGEPRPTPAELRDHLARLLPAALVPSVIVLLDALPVTANGKLDRAALPAPERTVPTRRPPAEPVETTELQQRIGEVLARVLDLPGVHPDDDFFDLGGDSFHAIRAVRELPGASVELLFRHPTARTLAAALEHDGQASARRDRLLRLTPRREHPRRTLIGVPYGGGNAVAFHPLARQLPDTTDVRAVRLPGHDLGAPEPLQSLESIAEEAADEILRTVSGPLALYGHCIGVALTVELAARLEQAGRPVDRVFLGGSFPFPSRQLLGIDLVRLVPFRRRESDEQVMRYLQSLGGFEELIDGEELAHVMTAFRHDGRTARGWFTRRQAEPDTARLRAPITFVAGRSDPETRNHRRRHREWERFSPSVELAVVPGGHYFVKHQAAELARVIEDRW
ncbi:amino acid adenylation domain-containing protein [Kitasatospora sp. NPDC089509]|uniref:non-ribosomal peptide synthetase n=1 Tax=Kitasatospora sp. NPDC089509 TaxID=3364079 RepID=UPI0037FF5960